MRSLRITDGVSRGPPATFHFDGEPVESFVGESVAAALLAAGRRALRRAPVDGGLRGAFCYMGVCQECLVEVDGVRREACRTPVLEGLLVSSVL